MTAPVRLRLSRARGFDLQAHSREVNGLAAVNVARPTKWGNPYDFRRSEFCWAALHYGCRGDRQGRQEASVRAYRHWLETSPEGVIKEARFGLVLDDGETPVDIGDHASVPIGRPAPTASEIATLRGKNLGCYCALGSPCHADVLLELANRPTCEAVDA